MDLKSLETVPGFSYQMLHAQTFQMVRNTKRSKLTVGCCACHCWFFGGVRWRRVCRFGAAARIIGAKYVDCDSHSHSHSHSHSDANTDPDAKCQFERPYGLIVDERLKLGNRTDH